MHVFDLFLLGYIVAINLVSFIMFGMDKAAARAQRRRTPEKLLFGVSALGGSLGSWAGMRHWRHKTKHASFRIGIPLLLILNAACLAGIYWVAGAAW